MGGYHLAVDERIHDFVRLRDRSLFVTGCCQQLCVTSTYINKPCMNIYRCIFADGCISRGTYVFEIVNKWIQIWYVYIHRCIYMYNNKFCMHTYMYSTNVNTHIAQAHLQVYQMRPSLGLCLGGCKATAQRIFEGRGALHRGGSVPFNIG